MRGALRPIRNRKTDLNFLQNRKTGRKIAQNRKNAESNDQNRNFVIFNPTTLDTTAKYYVRDHSMPLLYCLQREFVHLSRKKFLQCSTKVIASSIASASYEGETFVMKSKSFVQCANCSQEPNNRFFVHKNRNPNVKK